MKTILIVPTMNHLSLSSVDDDGFASNVTSAPATREAILQSPLMMVSIVEGEHRLGVP